MPFNSNDAGNIIYVESIDELRKRKLRPSDLNKKVVDKDGNEYRLKYNEKTKKVAIRQIAREDRKIPVKKEADKKTPGLQEDKSDVKTEGTIKPSDQTSDIDTPVADVTSKEKQSGAEESLPKDKNEIAHSADDIPIDSPPNIQLVVEKVIERLEMALKNILDSNVFNEKFNYDEKIIVDEIRSLVKSNIIEEFRNIREMREDIFKGFSDAKLEKNMYRDDLREIIKTKEDKEIIPFLREVDALEISMEGIENILEAFHTIQKKLASVPESTLSSKKHHERQRFSDGKLSLNTCIEDVTKIQDFYKRSYKRALNN